MNKMTSYRKSWLAKGIHGYLVIGTILVGVLIVLQLNRKRAQFSGIFVPELPNPHDRIFRGAHGPGGVEAPNDPSSGDIGLFTPA